MSGRSIGPNHVGEIDIGLLEPLTADPYTINPASGRIVLDFDGRISGGGLILAIESDALGRRDDTPSITPAAAGLTDVASALAGVLADLSPSQRLARLKIAHVRLCHSRMLFVRAYMPTGIISGAQMYRYEVPRDHQAVDPFNVLRPNE